MYPFLMRLNYNGNISSFTPTQSLFSSFSKSLKAFCLPFGYCCHLMSQSKTAMSLPFPKDSHDCAVYENNYLRATVVFLSTLK